MKAARFSTFVQNGWRQENSFRTFRVGRVRNFGELKCGGQFSVFLGGVVNFRLVFELGNCSLFIKVLQGKFGLC